MAEALAVVKVGNIECEFLKLTPLSRTSAIAGAVCGETMRARNPSGTNRIKLRGVLFCADAALAARANRLDVTRVADSSTIARRMKFSFGQGRFAASQPLSSFAVRRICYSNVG